MNKDPIIQIENLTKSFAAGNTQIRILHGLNLTLYRGEMVAIIGQSGSGKSTLMNILGCLDQPSGGEYLIFGKSMSQLDTEALAKLRREHFGFIFQRYHLLGEISAQDNVIVPAIYAGMDGEIRKQRAAELLSKLGLADKLQNRPNQLSGGQQQRVSIARALMNGGEVILADEPTGALDSRSGIEVMRILHQLKAAGHTIIMVTHDPKLAAQAERIIELKDGRIISDSYTPHFYTRHHLPYPNDDLPNENAENPTVNLSNNSLDNAAQNPSKNAAHSANDSQNPKDDLQNSNHTVDAISKSPVAALLDRLLSAFKMSLYAMRAHKMRTLLTMLGIIIGIASVVSVVGLGQGSQQKILADINQLGTNTITVIDGYPFGDPRRRQGYDNLTIADANAVAAQPYAKSVSPQVDSNTTARYKNIAETASVNGVGEGYLAVTGEKLAMGQSFNESSVKNLTQDIILDHNAYQTFFEGKGNPIGEVILVGNVPAQVIGVLERKNTSFGRQTNTPQLYMPYTTVMSRILGTSYLDRFVVLIDEATPSATAQTAISDLMIARHGTDDFNILNTDSIRQTVESTTQTMTILISSIAIISLIVGGIGVMNIMLVSVTERTGEIGVRMAVGARTSDIMQQFLIEAVLVCLLGGILGVGLAFAIGALINHFGSESFQVIYSPLSIAAAFICSTLIGVIFGFLPARNAARLNPVEALSRN